MICHAQHVAIQHVTRQSKAYISFTSCTEKDSSNLHVAYGRINLLKMLNY